jgi:hypothetical protein
MTPAKLWLSIFLPAFAVFTGLLFQTLVTPIPYGDLARIGRISDHDFGWRVAQPHVEPTQLEGVPVDKADILVIGDSFSSTNIWQSRLVKGGYGVTTVFWDSIDERLCSDFDGWLARSGFRGKLVIVESVERIFAIRMGHMQKCEHMDKPLTAQAAPRSPASERVPGFSLNWDAQLLSGWLTARCTRAAIAGRTASECDPQTVALPVPDGCERFTHRRCDRVLFLAGDRELGEISPEHAVQMHAFNQAQSSVPILWMVVPNKWTTYLEPTHSQAFVKALVQGDLGPDLFSFAQEQKTLMRDFYYPNDTHISMRGQLALGERMLHAVRQKLGAASPTDG